MKNAIVLCGLMTALAACEKAPEQAAAEPAKTETAAQVVAEPAAAAKTEVAQAPAAATATVGQAAPDFELKDETGKTHKLSDYKGKVVVLEWTNPGCPFVERHYAKDTMQTTFKAVGEEKVVWLAIDSSNFVTPEDSAKWKTDEGFTYPVLQDPSGAVGRVYQAKTTPHMFVVDAQGTLRYEGAIDSDPKGKEATPENYVEKAVKSLLEGKDVELPQTKPYGCSVKYS